MNDKEKRDDLITTCNAIQATVETVNDQLRECIIDLSDKITKDNAGTRSNKNGAFSMFIENVDVLSELDTVTGLVKEALNK